MDKVKTYSLLLVVVIGVIVAVSVLSWRWHVVGRAMSSVVERGSPSEGQGALLVSSGKVYVYGAKLIASKENGVVRYALQDYLGSNRFSVDSVGRLESRSVAYPFGKSLYEGSNFGAKESYLFTGKESDGNLYYFGARYYDPRVGRFVNTDPIPRSFTNYGYGKANPLRFTDPTGMRERDSRFVQSDATAVGVDKPWETVDYSGVKKFFFGDGSVNMGVPPMAGPTGQFESVGAMVSAVRSAGSVVNGVKVLLGVGGRSAAGEGALSDAVATEQRMLTVFHGTTIEKLPKIFQSGVLKSVYTLEVESGVAAGLSRAEAEAAAVAKCSNAPHKMSAWLSPGKGLAQEYGGANNAIIRFDVPLESPAGQELWGRMMTKMEGGKLPVPEMSTRYATEVWSPMPSNIGAVQKAMKPFGVPVTGG